MLYIHLYHNQTLKRKVIAQITPLLLSEHYETNNPVKGQNGKFSCSWITSQPLAANSLTSFT